MSKLRQARLVSISLILPLVFGVLGAVAQNPFVEVTEKGDLGDTPVDIGASWGDFDGDGDQDLYLASTGFDRLNPVYRNDGGHFTRMTKEDIGALGEDRSDALMGVWVDIDNDGDLDLYVANYLDGPWDGSSDPAQDVLYLNNGQGQFDRQEVLAFQTKHPSSVPSFADYDGDERLDLFLATYGGADALFNNEDALRFSMVPSVGKPTTGVGGSWADVDGDGDLDFFAASLSNKDPSWLYLNSRAQGEIGTFEPTTSFPSGGVAVTRVNSPVPWGDVDNDGDLDGLATHWAAGFELLVNDGGGSFSKQTLALKNDYGSGAIAWLDADNDGDLDILVGTIFGNADSGPRTFALLSNLGNGQFEETLIIDGIDPNGWRGMAIADYDNDGFMDCFLPISNFSSSSPDDQLLRNLGNDNHWLKLLLKGTVSNASAVGAVVRLRATIRGAERWQMRLVTAGGDGLWTQHDSRPNFGLGDATAAEVVRIEWPSGIIQELTGVAADQILTVVEPARLNLEGLDGLSWRSSKAREFALESAPKLAGPWSPATETAEVDGNLRTATIDTTDGNRFYRLQNTPSAPIPPNPDPDTLVWLTPGTFLMGSPETEPEREPLGATTDSGDETLHEVTLSAGFWISRFEITQPKFLALMGSNPSAFTGPSRQPVDSVTWHEAMAYCKALTTQEEAAGRLPEGFVYRLPTEAEWEYACRARTSTVFHTGDELRSRQANFDGTREYSVAEGGTVENAAGVATARPTPVGQTYFVANAWGLSDMIGNVSEWCLDRMAAYPDGPVTDPYAPGPTEEVGAVVRGGAWGDPGSACRSAHRDDQAPSLRDNHVGFRVVLARPLE